MILALLLLPVMTTLWIGFRGWGMVLVDAP